jgi:hypothetical protein
VTMTGPREEVHAVLWDLDSTLFDTRGRRHLMPPPEIANSENGGGAHAWIEYSAACADDPPIEGAIRLRKLMAT